MEFIKLSGSHPEKRVVKPAKKTAPHTGAKNTRPFGLAQKLEHINNRGKKNRA